jgi:hypothetical protein
MYPRDRVFFPDLTVEEGIRIVLTGGMSLPGRIEGLRDQQTGAAAHRARAHERS